MKSLAVVESWWNHAGIRLSAVAYPKLNWCLVHTQCSARGHLRCGQKLYFGLAIRVSLDSIENTVLGQGGLHNAVDLLQPSLHVEDCSGAEPSHVGFMTNCTAMTFGNGTVEVLTCI